MSSLVCKSRWHSKQELPSRAYNADIHIRVTDRIRTVLESTSLPLPTVFLALWYISRFPFTVSAADGNSPRDAFYRLLCGYGTVHTEYTIFLAFMAGVMLANKTNDDFPLSIREWCVLYLEATAFLNSSNDGFLLGTMRRYTI
jgi:hypothetical protein